MSVNLAAPRADHFVGTPVSAEHDRVIPGDGGPELMRLLETLADLVNADDYETADTRKSARAA